MKVTIWDVQHGSAAWIRTSAKKDIVVDLGVGDSSERRRDFSPIAEMRRLGVGMIDLLIITHPHRDHLDDITVLDTSFVHGLLRPRMTPEFVRQANRTSDTEVVESYLRFEAAYGIDLEDDANPAIPSNNGNVEVQCFTPHSFTPATLNNSSIVSFFTFGGVRICIPGDNELASWRELLKQDGFAEALAGTHVFVASHHGRESGYSQEVFQYCSPLLCVVSDGPETDTSAVDRYTYWATGYDVVRRSTGETVRRKVLTTRQDGTIELIFGDSTLDVSVE